VGPGFTRIISDVHYGDRASRVRSLEQLRPLLEGPGALILNGDTTDTRPEKDREQTERRRREVLDFFGRCGIPVTFLTGNHDPDVSGVHQMSLEGEKIFVTHGDILFDSIVPWSRDAPMIRSKLIAALAAVPDTGSGALERRLGVFRAVAGAVPQRHQTERDPVKYALRFVSDTVWPPGRALKILRAWREAPGRAASLARKHRPKARFVMIGHTHKPGFWRTEAGVVVINTGSFCPPFGAIAADVEPGKIRIRKIDFTRGQFHPGRTVAEFQIS
jgi:predicted phosphodiesterase